VQVAIDARRQHFDRERVFAYQPFEGLEDEYRFNESNVEQIISNYNLLDLSI